MATALAQDVGLEPFDSLFALFTNIFQMRDWIRASRPDLREEVDQLFRRSVNLALVRDLANGSKHMDVTRYGVDGAATVMCEYTDWGNRYVIPLSDAPNRDTRDLVDACIAELRTFMETHGLV